MKIERYNACRIKRKPILNRIGIRCRNIWQEANNKLWPGDVGELKQRELRGVDWKQLAIVAEFSHGRELRLACTDMVGLDEAHNTEFKIEETSSFDLDDFKFLKV